MKLQYRNRINTLRAQRNAADKAERIFCGRSAGRARKARIHAVSTRANSLISSFFRQVKRRSPRALGVLAAAILLLVALPAALLLGAGKKNTHEHKPAPAKEALVLDVGSRTLSSGTQALDNIPALPEPPTPTPEPHPTNMIFKEGMSAPVVAEIQEQLMELGYMDNDEPTEYFGPITKSSIKLFQRKHGLPMDGCVGMETYSMLISSEATKYSVSIGVEGTDVKELQIRLRELGYLDKATEYFGTETEAAVKKFQERNGLSMDGTVGEKTREMLYSDDAKANYFERGEVNEKILSYQNRLKKLGYLTTEADGKYGNDTEAAVKRFQERSGLIADGYLGPQTIENLLSSNAQANALMIGMKGTDVENVQKRLKELNYLKSVDGYYGSNTEGAVRAFQERNSLSVDGKVGKRTMSLLTSDDAKKAGSTSGSSTSGGSSSSRPPAEGQPQVETPSRPSGKVVSVEAFLDIARSKLGSRYVRGAKGPSSFDCSGFVYWCLNQAGVSQGYMTSASWQKTTKYQRISNMSSLQSGDIVSFKGHVGIYLGGGQMIDASSGQGKVRITSSIQSSAYWSRHFVAGFRVF